jgi:hypothetical protein
MRMGIYTHACAFRRRARPGANEIFWLCLLLFLVSGTKLLKCDSSKSMRQRQPQLLVTNCALRPHCRPITEREISGDGWGDEMGYVMFLGNRRALRTLRANKVNMWEDGNKGEGEKKTKTQFSLGGRS